MWKLGDVGKLRAHSPPYSVWLLCSIHPQNLSKCTGKVLPGECKNLNWNGYSLLDLGEFQLLSWLASENSPDITQLSFSSHLGDMEVRLLYIFHSGQLWRHPRWYAQVLCHCFEGQCYVYLMGMHFFLTGPSSFVCLGFFFFAFFLLLLCGDFEGELLVLLGFFQPSDLSLTHKCFNVELAILQQSSRYQFWW